MSPAILDSEFSTTSLSSYYTTPSSMAITMNSSLSQGIRKKEIPSSMFPIPVLIDHHQPGTEKHPHVWDIPMTSRIPIDDIDQQQQQQQRHPSNEFEDTQIPDFLVNVNQALNSITKNDQLITTNTHHSPLAGTTTNPLLPPIEINKWRKTRPNGPREQNKPLCTAGPGKLVKSSGSKHKASFYILDNENEHNSHDKDNDMDESDAEGYFTLPTLYQIDSSRKRSIEGHAISPSDNTHNDNDGSQMMKFRIVNPDSLHSSRFSSCSLGNLNPSDIGDYNSDEGSLEDRRWGSIDLGSDFSAAELTMRLAEYSITPNHNYDHMSRAEDQVGPCSINGENQTKRQSLLGKAIELVSGKNRAVEEGTCTEFIQQPESGHSNSYFGNWRKWRKPEDRRTASEDWTGVQHIEHSKCRQGSTSTSNTKPATIPQVRKRKFPNLSFDLGLNARRSSHLLKEREKNRNGDRGDGAEDEDDWDGGLLPIRSPSASHHARRGSRGWKGILTAF